jgi:methionyl-tRNA formyltransferase
MTDNARIAATEVEPVVPNPKLIRLVFMGTPDFAVPSLQALHAQAAKQGWSLVAAVTQPDRPAGRGKQVALSPVKQQALAYELPILQPASLRKDPQAVEALAALMPDLLIVAAYGLILPKRVLEIPSYGCINVHASLLPAYRGASPITAAILDGLEETGVSIMLMDEGMDTGPVLAQARQPMYPDDTTASLSDRLAAQGAGLLVDTLPRWLSGELAPTPQSSLPGTPSTCRLIQKEQGAIDWNAPAVRIERMTRAYTPWPSAYAYWRGEPFKIWQAEVRSGHAPAGQVVDTADGPAVGTGEGLLLLRTVQPAGKRALDIRSFLNGAPGFIGSQLAGEESRA